MYGIGLLVLCTLIVYSNSLLNGFVWDDLVVVVAKVDSSQLTDIPGLFLQADSIGNIGAPYYRPLNLATYIVDHFLYGNHPAGYHLTNLAFHVLAVLFLYLVSIELFERKSIAWIASLLFAVHPINAETVNFISARNNILASLFVLMSLYAYIRHERSKRGFLLPLSAFLFLLGLFCKETAAMLLAVLALRGALVWRRLEPLRALAARLWPFAVSVALYLGLRAIALSETPGIDLQLENLASRLSLHLTILPKYLGLVLLPVELSVSRLPPDGGYPLSLWTLLVWVAIAAGGYGLWRSKSPATRLGLLWFAVNYIPISNVVPTPSAAMAERFLYLPAIGIWWIAADQLVRIDERSRGSRPLRAAFVGVSIALACLAFARSFDWRSNVSLFEEEVKINPSLAENHYNLCTSYLEEGDPLRAEAACLEADRLGPGDANVLTQLGNLQQAQRRYERAVDFYRRAVEADASHLNARYNLARLLENLGRRGEASGHFQTLYQTLPAEHPLRADVRRRLQGLARSLQAVP
jgi:tetratricopeptide (TPR) repeat protein